MTKKILILTLSLLTITLVSKAQVEILSGGSSAAYTVVVPGAFKLTNGLQVSFKAHTACSASATLNVSSTGNISITKIGGSAPLSGSDILAGQIVTVAFDGTNWQMLSAVGSTPAAPTNYWSPNGADIYNNNAGNVGVGLSSPLSKFEVRSNGSSVTDALFLSNTNSGDNYGTKLAFRSQFIATPWTNAEILGITSGGVTQGSLIFKVMKDRATTNLIEAMRIDGDGNVGIGTSPTEKLHVTGGQIYNNWVNTNSNIPNLYIRNWNSGSGPGIMSGTLGQVTIATSDGADSKYAIQGSAGGDGGYKYGIYGNAMGTGTNYGGSFTSSGGANNYALYAVGDAAGTSNGTGTYSTVGGNGTGTTYGVYGQNSSSVTGATYAGNFENFNSAGSIIYGVRSSLNGNSGAGGSKYGVRSDVTGTAPYNYAGYFSASGATNNYAIVVPNGGGYVGIGTITPSLPLDVANNTQTTTSRFMNTFNGASNTAVYGGATGASAGGVNYGGSFNATGSTGNNYAVYGYASGNSGAKTGVYGWAAGTGNNIGGYFTASGGTTNNALQLVDGSQANNRVLTSDAVGRATWTDLSALLPTSVWTENATSIYPTNWATKKVGVGTNAPVGMFDVTTSTLARGSQIQNSFSTTAAKFGIYAIANGGGTGDNNGGWFDASGNGTGINYGVGAQALGTAGENRAVYGAAVGGTTNWAGYFAAGNVYIQNNLGIGTTVPDGKLHLAETKAIYDGSDGAFAFIQNTDATASFGQLAGIKFRTDGVGAGANARYKGGIVFQKTGSWGVGDLLFLTNSAGSNASVTAADEKMRITSIGDVGIGVTPSYKLHVVDNSTSNVALFTNTTTTGGVGVRGECSLNNASSAATRTGVYGTAWYGTGENRGGYFYGFGGTTAYGVYGQASGGTINWGVYSLGDMYVGGQLGVNNLTPTYAIDLQNTTTNSLGRGRAFAWDVYSDKRLKDNIKEIPYGLQSVLDLKPLMYNQHNSSIDSLGMHIEKESAVNIGFLAQDLYKIVPQVVSKPEDESKDFWAVDYSKLVPVLTKAIQEQQKMIDDLKKEVEALKNK